MPQEYIVDYGQTISVEQRQVNNEIIRAACKANNRKKKNKLSHQKLADHFGVNVSRIQKAYRDILFQQKTHTSMTNKHMRNADLEPKPPNSPPCPDFFYREPMGADFADQLEHCKVYATPYITPGLTREQVQELVGSFFCDGARVKYIFREYSKWLQREGYSYSFLPL